MKFMRKLFVVAIAMFVLAVGIPALAQDDPETGSGGPILEPNFGDDIKTLNPIISTDGPSNTMIRLLFPPLIDFDPDSIAWEQGAGDSVATGWTVSEDGTTYTFSLRDDWTWSDGTPVTASDYIWTWNAIQGGAPSPATSLANNVESMTAIDDHTLEVKFKAPDCTALDTLNEFYAVPATVYEDVFGTDYANMGDSDYNLNPTVTAAEFIFSNYRPGEQVTLLANPDFANPEMGAVIPEGYIFKNVTDQVVQMEQFYANELTWIPSVPQAARAEARERAANGEVQIYEAPSISIRFLSFNLADPTNPQDGLDADGNALEQGIHPILGDKRVRQALEYAVDFDPVNQGAFFGEEQRVSQMALPQSWAFNPDVAPYTYDPEKAMSLLDEAGWTDADGDGVRECNGCGTTEDGTPLHFVLMSNAGNTSQEALYTILQDQWSQIGFDVEVQFNDFNTILDAFLGQTYDAVGLFLSFSVPDNPNDLADLFMPTADVLGGGSNASSFNNERVNELLTQARTLPGCDLEERAALYREVQEILHEEVPWMFISTGFVPSIAQPYLENWEPKPGSGRWNIDAWMVPGE